VDYDVDWINVRAGWLLEELTFQNFGYQEGVIDHDAIMNTVIKGKSDAYIDDLKKKLKGQDAKKQARILAVQKAKDWWQNVNKPWKRFDAVVDGLKSKDEALQYRIFQWLNNGDTKCEGLTLETFDKFILPEVKRLSYSESKEIKEGADSLLKDRSKENWWYRYKLK
jgi:hypothetical protein